MKIWVDADACPIAIKEILYRAARRTGVLTTFVANQVLKVPPSPHIRTLRVEQGFDKADDQIVALVDAGDLVITQDIPLAAEVLEKKGLALNPRGVWFSTDDIKARLTLRDFYETMRGSGIHSGGPNALGPKDKQTFANALDSWLAKINK